MMYNNNYGDFGFNTGGHMMRSYQHGFFNASPEWFLGVSLFGVLLLTIIIVWSVAIKGYALWHAAKRNEKWWFIALLIINTAGILELVYLIFFAKVLFQKSPAVEVTEHKADHHTHSEHQG